MNNNSLFKILLHQRNISTEELLGYFACTKEEMIGELVVFLNEELKKLPNKPKNISSFFFSTANRLDELYSMLLKEEKENLPYYDNYSTIRMKLIQLSKSSEVKWTMDPSLESFFLDLFYYQDCKEVKKKLQKNPEFMNLVHEGNKLFYYLLKYYYQSFTSSMKEYGYYKKLIEYILCSEQIDADTKLEMIHHFEKESQSLFFTINDQYPEYQYRIKEAGLLFGTCKKKLIKPLSNYAVSIKKKVIDKRKDPTPIFTIDGEGTVLREDAISVLEKQNHIKITMYITDVSEHLKDNKKLQQVAFSNWFEKISDEIFNLEYAVQSFSLEEGEIRNVIAYEFDFNQEFVLEKFTIYPAIIQVSKNFSYDQVNHILQNKKNKHKETFELLSSVCNHLHESNKHKRKYHMLKELDRSLSGKENTRAGLDKNAGIIVSELKIASGYILAKYFLQHQIPAIYRNNKFIITDHKMEDIKKACNEQDDVEEVKKRIEQTNIQSYYSDICEGHKGLNLDCYMHMTTPARNYFSLVNSYIFKEVCIEQKRDKLNQYWSFVRKLSQLQKDKDQYRNKVYKLEKSSSDV